MVWEILHSFNQVSKHPTQQFHSTCFQFQDCSSGYEEPKLTIFSTHRYRQELGTEAFAVIFIGDNRQQHAAIGQLTHRK